MAVVQTDGGMRLTALLAAISALGAGAVLFIWSRRVSRSQDAVRGEIDVLAMQPLTEMLADVVKSRNIAEFRKRLPAVSDAGLAQLTDRVEEACATALRMAVEHEDLRVGYTEVFVNMFRRTQTLLQRQLQVIERLEQGNRSPADMHLFFQLDHLVTRMRRNNENVLVLAGTELVRATKNPVTIADVFRAAMSEVDKYQKIRVLGTPSIRVSNTAAGDLIRIIAELLDNATSFSAPTKEVTINAELGRHNGLSIGVFDNGIGMSDEDIRKTNEQLKKLGSEEIARSRRVGLFVVGRLAGRNGFKVELFGGDDVEGVSALISVPSSVLLEEDAMRAMLPGDSRRTTTGAKQASSTGPSVAVTTSVRRTSTPHVTGNPASGRRRMSSWYGRSQAWRAERDNVRKGPSGADAGAQQVDRTHEGVAEELPMRVPGKRAVELAAETAVRQQALAAESQAAEPPAEPTDVPERAAPAPAPRTREPEPLPEDRGTRVASRWFKARGNADEPALPARTGQPEQEQASRTAEPATDPAPCDYTEDGLPLRRQGAHLQATIATGDPAPEMPKEIRAVERDPAHMRRRLSSYQLGVQKAKEQEDRMRGRQQQAGGWTVLERKATK
ncbi:ATP-binding protein [Lentzea sp. NPDC102401]|uniref:ATP-binding protein n=1 Tax=Lentzea sp. NPDC102401 TaxID=3364128 RepID=UPI0037F9821F